MRIFRFFWARGARMRCVAMTLTAAAKMLAATTQANAQPVDYYRLPVDIPVAFSANFGEIRVNRFHTGVDIKTQGTTGKELKAAADGYISRVTVAPGGYGRAIYVAHPNGTTTVYAHLERFTTEVENYLCEERNRLKLSDLDAYPPAQKFPVKKGDPVGLSGNSGASAGPHLHFEVRESATARTLNPIARGWLKSAAKDTTKPRIVRLYVVDTDTVTGVPMHSKPRAYDVKLNPDGSYSLLDPATGKPRTTPLRTAPASYFVVEATDRRPDVANTFGIFRARLAVDGDEKVVFEKDGVRFDEVRYACVSTLYDIQRRSRNEAVMLATKHGNRLGMYKKSVDRGVVRLSPDGAPRDIAISVEDDSQNAATLRFTVAADPAWRAPERPEGRVASDDREFTHFADGLAVNIPAGALYEPIFYTQLVVSQQVKPRADSVRPLTPLYKVGDGTMPLHKAARVAIASPQNERAVLAKVAANGSLAWAGGRYKNGAVEGSVRDFGVYCVVADERAPTVAASFAEGADLTASGGFTLTARDNFSGIASFVGSIDGEWIIFERTASRGEFRHRFSDNEIAAGTTHELEFTVKDGAGNMTIFRRTFRK